MGNLGISNIVISFFTVIFHFKWFFRDNLLLIHENGKYRIRWHLGRQFELFYNTSVGNTLTLLRMEDVALEENYIFPYLLPNIFKNFLTYAKIKIHLCFCHLNMLLSVIKRNKKYDNEYYFRICIKRKIATIYS